MTRKQAADYIHSLAAELAKIARSNGLVVAAHCLAITALETSEALVGKRSKRGIQKNL